jgi:septal ring factor EnvC (AmiA/AmiB activator)
LLLFRIAVFACLAAAQGAGADPQAVQPRKELAQVREHIESARKSRDALEARKNELDAQLSEAERSYGRLAQALKELEIEASAQSQRTGALKRQREDLLARARRQRRALAGQARAAYAQGRQEWLKLLLNQEEPSRLTRVLAYYKCLNQARVGLLQSMEQELAESQRLQEALAQEAQRLAETRRRIDEERSALEESRQVRRGLLAKLEHQLRDQDLELKRLQEDERRLQDLLATLRPKGDRDNPAGNAATPPSPSSPEASPACPVAGRLVGQFGSPRMNGRWDGLVIAAEEGAPVRAVADGRVAYSDWLRGYGLLTIVDHGDGVMSLYAFNQSLYKGVGDRVAVGEVIAAVGASGGRAEPALYFGIREQGRAVDPSPWCGRRR